ncbi:hypothetical protein [Rhizobium ruizarguesonis]|uniref:hypothetical protein n=1 Tax=Rhizobium ruizarguesonis TaxID=2081791 RepID=UPI0010311B0C|nr:hypothetical protein [Rhizobium ruizarguesonis]TAZ76556.1 hypothetical protein ELH68_01635 [Rhizobium ruizarguesonis]TBA03189.1 hypothetical protein ELH64_01620 [Rhizobium ruizarguesonis]
MSLIISAVYTDSVVMLTDGATIDEDGILQMVGTKVAVSRSLPLAVSCRGSYAICSVLLDAVATVSEMGTFDQTIATVEAMILQNRGMLEKEGLEFELMIAGISETVGACHFHMASKALEGFYDAWAMKLLDYACMIFGGVWDRISSGVSDEMLIAAGEDGFRQYGVQIVDAMRAAEGNEPGAARPGCVVIGGRLDLTVITRDGATIERLHTWPDVIGKRIDPLRLPQAA